MPSPLPSPTPSPRRVSWVATPPFPADAADDSPKSCSGYLGASTAARVHGDRSAEPKRVSMTARPPVPRRVSSIRRSVAESVGTNSPDFKTVEVASEGSVNDETESVTKGKRRLSWASGMFVRATSLNMSEDFSVDFNGASTLIPSASFRSHVARGAALAEMDGTPAGSPHSLSASMHRMSDAASPKRHLPQARIAAPAAKGRMPKTKEEFDEAVRQAAEKNLRDVQLARQRALAARRQKAKEEREKAKLERPRFALFSLFRSKPKALPAAAPSGKGDDAAEQTLRKAGPQAGAPPQEPAAKNGTAAPSGKEDNAAVQTSPAAHAPPEQKHGAAAVPGGEHDNAAEQTPREIGLQPRPAAKQGAAAPSGKEDNAAEQPTPALAEFSPVLSADEPRTADRSAASPLLSSFLRGAARLSLSFDNQRHGTELTCGNPPSNDDPSKAPPLLPAASRRSRFVSFLSTEVGALLTMAVGTLFFALQAALVKIVAELGVPSVEVAFIRSIVQGLGLLAWLLYSAQALWGPPGMRRMVFFRGALGGVGVLFMFHASEALPVGDATTLYSLHPVVTVVVAWLLFGDRIRPAVVVGALATIAGSILIARPSFIFDEAGPSNATGVVDEAELPRSLPFTSRTSGIVAALLASLVIGCIVCLIRFVRKATTAQQLWPWCVTCAVVSGTVCASTESFVWPSAAAWGYIAVLNVCGISAVFCLNHAAKNAASGPTSLVRTMEIVFSYILQMVLFHDHPPAWSVVGALLILLAISLITIEKCYAADPAPATPLPTAGDSPAGQFYVDIEMQSNHDQQELETLDATNRSDATEELAVH
ncbi:putative membrane protein [Diplonema papillatum]|nr:putative membrane protein [Diplonema papillatum]|eukprot:gene13103-20220_t